MSDTPTQDDFRRLSGRVDELTKPSESDLLSLLQYGELDPETLLEFEYAQLEDDFRNRRSGVRKPW